VAPKALKNSIMKFWYLLGSLLLLSLLSGCNGLKSDDSEGSKSTIGQNAQLTVVVTDTDGKVTNRITSGNSLNITATLTDSNNNAIENQRVEFQANLGSLSSNSRLSNESGQVTVSFNSTSVESGVITLTTSTTINDEQISLESEFEVVQSNISTPEQPTISLSLIKDGNNVWEIRENEEARLSVELLDSQGTAIQQARITFSAELGALIQSSALTDDSGLAGATLTAIQGQLGAGDAVASTEINGVIYSDTLRYEIIEEDATGVNLDIGYFDENDNFVAGTIFSEFTDSMGNTNLNAGSAIDLTVALVEEETQQRYTGPAVVEFKSDCADDGLAELNSSIKVVSGEAKTTFKDISCAISGDKSDTIIASVTTNSVQIDASLNINISGEPVNSIRFVSAEPQSIVVKGTGGVGNTEESTLSFLVTSAQGNPLPNKTVSFQLNTDVGGVSLSETSDVTNSEGLVNVQVTSGTVPTVVRVTASTTENGETFSTQSDLLSINTGLPDQNSITIALERINPEADDSNIGEQVKVSAFLADSFNNPVPDGTAVNFTTEGGAIEPSCTTTNGNCAVTWTSQEPYPSNHRVTILATAVGHEYFVDVNGDNVFNEADGDSSMNDSLDSTELARIQSGFGRLSPQPSGFLDMTGAWRDDNEDNLYNAGELPIAQDSDGGYEPADNEFNGPLCEDNLCSDSKFITIRKATVLITSSSRAYYRLINSATNEVLQSNYVGDTQNTVSIPKGNSASFQLEVSDVAFQIMPVGTSVTITTTAGELNGDTQHTFANSRGTSDPDGYGGIIMNFSVANNTTAEDTSLNGTIEISITTPKSITTQTATEIIIE